MSAIPPTDDRVPPVGHEAEGLAVAAYGGKVCSVRGKALNDYGKGAGVGGDLRLSARWIGVGSLVADLVVIGNGTAAAIARHQEALYGAKS